MSSKYRIGKGCRVIYSELKSYVKVGSNCDIAKTEIGKYTYLGNNAKLPFTKIGAFTSIASDVILAVGMHPIEYVSTSPATYSMVDVFNKKLIKRELPFQEYAYTDETHKFYCEIGNDVWIATRVTLVCGKKALCIGDGAVIRAGAVVTKDVPPYAIVQGVPAQVVGYRFEPNVIERLLELKWWDKSDDWISQNVECFNDVEKFFLKVKEDVDEKT